MRTTTITFIFNVLLLVAAEEQTYAADTIAVKGSYTNQGKTTELTGIFTSKAKGKWDVTWRFDAGKRGPQVFEGTAEGSLTSGKMSGRVMERRLFTFEGTWEKEGFTGTTAEYFDPKGKAYPTGTMELSVTR